MSSNKKIKLEESNPSRLNKRKLCQEDLQITSTDLRVIYKRIKNNQYYCCIHMDKEVCDIYMCGGVQIYIQQPVCNYIN